MLVKQISNLFSLMDHYVRVGRPLSVREIVEEFSWPRSSVFNMVSTLVEEGYLYQPVPRGGYYPSSKWMDLARNLAEAEPLPESVHELLLDLMNQTGETLSLAAAEGASVVLLDVVEPAAVIRYTASVGDRLPIQVTAAGRAILSLYPATERTAILKRVDYRPYGDARFLSAAEVEEDIQRGAARGWYVNRGAYDSDLAGVAVPFPYRNRRIAIVLGAPLARVDGRIDQLGELLLEAVSGFLAGNA